MAPSPTGSVDAASVRQIEIGVCHHRIDIIRYRHEAGLGTGFAPGDAFQAAGLKGEAEIHRFDGIAERPRAGEIGHVAPAEHMEGAAVAEMEGLDVVGLVAVDAGDIGMAAESLDIDLMREMAAIHQDRTILDERQVGRRHDSGKTRDGDDDIRRADRRIAQRRDEAVEMSLERRYRIDVDDADGGKGITETGSRALPQAP